MLPLKNRLISRKDFEAVHRYGSFFSFGSVLLKVKNTDSGSTRIGFSVGLRFSKKAVERNRLKRQLREIAKKHLEKIREGADIVVMVKARPREVNFETLDRDFKEALKRGKLIN